MARVVFFSFDYDDVWRVNQVRKSGAFVGEQRAGFRDKAEYEQVKRQGDNAIKSWIRTQMQGCSVTCVLIGTATHRSKWVRFEINESINKGMGLVGVYMHKLKDEQGASSNRLFAPHNPLDDHQMPHEKGWSSLFSKQASEHFETHTWEPPAGLFASIFCHNELGAWVEEAARRAERGS